ncbi:MAG: hypothetical protein KF729_16975 [Sandaracinaceae bacterium]|nr:hypothetical protein [Sandaracinaceae bacterium]
MSRDVIVTDVGCAGYGANFVRGERVADLQRKGCSRWSLVSRYSGGSAIEPDDAAFLEEVLLATSAPDPRIWPLKVAWLIGSFGDWWAAGAAVQAMLGECRLGPWAGGATCATVEAFVRLRQEDPASFRARAVDWIESRWSNGEIVWG